MKQGRWVLTCPKCRHEFVYDNDAVMNKRKELSDKLSALKKEKERLKCMICIDGRQEYKRNQILKQNGIEQDRVMRLLHDLKTMEHTANTAIEQARLREFLELISEKIGYEETQKIWDIVDEMFRPENIRKTMARSYTRSSSRKNVISINKI